MPNPWSINAEWASLEGGSPEEKAGFAALSIYAYDTCLTAGHDRLLQCIREAPYLSTYHFAEWLAWNWWRLRWEPRKISPDWEFSHAMASIGGGYIWPNIHFVSDGENVALIGKPTPERARTPFRYINDCISQIQANQFESEIDIFIDAVLQRMKDRQISETNLGEIWRAVQSERQDEQLRELRKLEALLGEDPGEMDETLLCQILGIAEYTGQAALEEIAASRVPGQAAPDINGVLELGRTQGTRINPHDRITLRGQVPQDLKVAWKVGTYAAQLLRNQEGIAPNSPITNERLADMYGAPHEALEAAAQSTSKIDFSFALTEPNNNRVMLRSAWESGRRFGLARLLGDSLVYDLQDPIRPATRTYTYRQKLQRAFAAEFLSPFSAVDAMLEGDYSTERQQDVAHHFGVSSLTIRTLLVNHNRVDRTELAEIG